MSKALAKLLIAKSSRFLQPALFAVPVSVDVGLRLEPLHQISLLQQAILTVFEQEADLFYLFLIVVLVS